MRIPLNVIQWYVGWPFLFAIVLRGILVRKTSQNITNWYFTIACAIYLTSFTAGGLPPLLGLDSQYLTFGVMIASILDFLATFVLWLLVAHMYFPKNNLMRKIITGIALILLICGLFIAVQENLAIPTTMVYVDGAWNIIFPFSFSYRIITAIQYLSMIFIAVKFWLSSKNTTDIYLAIRLKVFAVAITLIGCIFYAAPFQDTHQNFTLPQALIVLAGVISMAVFLIVTILLKKRKATS